MLVVDKAFRVKRKTQGGEEEGKKKLISSAKPDGCFENSKKEMTMRRGEDARRESWVGMSEQNKSKT